MSIVINGSGTITGITAGGLPDATITQAELASNVAGNGPAFYAYQNVQQTGIAVTTSTKITLDAESFDTNNNFASSRFTPTVAGYYYVNAGVSIPSASSSAMVQGTLRKNGVTDFNACASIGQTGTLYPQSTGSWLVYMNGSTDYLEMYVYGTGPGTFSLLTGAYATFFSGTLVKAA